MPRYKIYQTWHDASLIITSTNTEQILIIVIDCIKCHVLYNRTRISTISLYFEQIYGDHDCWQLLHGLSDVFENKFKWINPIWFKGHCFWKRLNTDTTEQKMCAKASSRSVYSAKEDRNDLVNFNCIPNYSGCNISAFCYNASWQLYRCDEPWNIISLVTEVGRFCYRPCFSGESLTVRPF